MEKHCLWFNQWWARNADMWDYGSDETGREIETAVFKKIGKQATAASLIRVAAAYGLIP